jgi:hypothetical protein
MVIRLRAAGESERLESSVLEVDVLSGCSSGSRSLTFLSKLTPLKADWADPCQLLVNNSFLFSLINQSKILFRRVRTELTSRKTLPKTCVFPRHGLHSTSPFLVVIYNLVN